jgi:hypothetical protein
MISSKMLFRLLCLTLLVAGTDAQSQVLTHGGVAPLTKIPSEQWIEKVVGDMDKPGQPFVIRIHHDAGYVVLPHTHPEDENITVLTGSWALGMGSRVNMAELKPMEQGRASPFSRGRRRPVSGAPKVVDPKRPGTDVR